MIDKQQIEEMAKAISNSCDLHNFDLKEAEIDLIAIALYNARYRKIPENAVVLAQEECDALLAKLERYKNKKAWAVTKEVCEEYRKETAKEILDKVSRHYGGAWLVELYKEYGVEVE